MDDKVLADAKVLTDKAKIQLMRDPKYVFYTNVLFMLKMEYTNAVPMLATDGYSLIINPDYWITRSPEECVNDFLHEIMHIILLHITRIKMYPKANMEKYNVAADYSINNILLDSGVNLDSTFIIDRTYVGMSTEEIYNQLPDKPPSNFKKDIKPGGYKPSEGKDENLEEHIKNILSNAKVQSEVQKAWDSIHSEVKRHVNGLLEPTLPWQEILANRMLEHDKEDYNWSRRNRRYDDVYLPGLYSEHFGEVNIYIDTSGSITKEEFIEFLSETQGIIDILEPTQVNFYCWGSTITEKVEIFPEEKLLDKCKLIGCGGTEIKYPLNSINETSPEIAIIYTDGEFSSKKISVETDLIWVIKPYGKKKFNWPQGEIIYLEDS